jgi:hypothetical protein
VHADAGHPLSAIADTQVAVLESLTRHDDVPRSPRRVAAARVVAQAALVQQWISGDPDLVGGAADRALGECLQGLNVGDDLVLTPDIADIVGRAATVAYVAHAAAGRDELARAARWFAEATADGGGFQEPVRLIESVRSEQPTLAAVLQAEGQDRYLAVLTAPATDKKLLVPAMRVDHQVAPAYGATLGELQPTATGANERLLGLEAHALFAWASHRSGVNMRYQFNVFGVAWLTAVLTFGQRHREESTWPAVADAADWLAAIIERLLPYARIDADVRRNVSAGLDWQHEVYLTLGEADAADRVGKVQALLRQWSDQ